MATNIALSIVLFAIGFYVGAREMIREYRALKDLYALLRITSDRALRKQIRAQYAADKAVRRATTVDPWLGRGGQYVFWPQIPVRE